MSPVPSYHGYRFPPEIIGHAVWFYHRFCLSFRDAEDLLAQRGVTVTYETIARSRRSDCGPRTASGVAACLDVVVPVGSAPEASGRL